MERPRTVPGYERQRKKIIYDITDSSCLVTGLVQRTAFGQHSEGWKAPAILPYFGAHFSALHAGVVTKDVRLMQDRQRSLWAPLGVAGDSPYRWGVAAEADAGPVNRRALVGADDGSRDNEPTNPSRLFTV